MNFFKKLFGGGGGGNNSEPYARYFYVRPKRCNEIVKIRIDVRNDLSLADEGGYFVRKVARATRCPFPAELHLNFDDKHNVTQVGVQDGEMVEEADYQAWLATQPGQPQP
jgi:hypothetical protein